MAGQDLLIVEGGRSRPSAVVLVLVIAYILSPIV